MFLGAVLSLTDGLSSLIVDQKFANAVRTMRIYCSARRDRDGSMAFQTGAFLDSSHDGKLLTGFGVQAC